MFSILGGSRMISARTVGRALSLLDSELAPYTPYCAAPLDAWRFDSWSCFIGIIIGVVLLPLIEVLVAFRVWAIRRLLSPAPTERTPASRSLYRLH